MAPLELLAGADSRLDRGLLRRFARKRPRERKLPSLPIGREAGSFLSIRPSFVRARILGAIGRRRRQSRSVDGEGRSERAKRAPGTGEIRSIPCRIRRSLFSLSFPLACALPWPCLIPFWAAQGGRTAGGRFSILGDPDSRSFERQCDRCEPRSLFFKLLNGSADLSPRRRVSSPCILFFFGGGEGKKSGLILRGGK